MQSKLNLEGQGATYVRISTDVQDTKRQYASLKHFLKDNDVELEATWWFEDTAFRDDESRPDFRRLLKLAESGTVNWIVVDATERFDMKSPKRFVGLLGDLEEWECKLFTVDGQEWTQTEISTDVNALFRGHASYKEGVDRSWRVLGKQALQAKDGLYVGGLPPFGIDVATYANKHSTDELWRVVWQPELGRHKRIKVFPDGTEERWDGKENMPPIGNEEVRRFVPSRQQMKLEAVCEVFRRYRTQKISFNALAGYLNRLGYRAGGGSLFSATHLPSMLSQPAYIGKPAWNRRHVGKFHGWTNGRQTRMKKPTTSNGKKRFEENGQADWIISEVQVFEPIVDLETWGTVQEKLAAREPKPRQCRSDSFILSGLLICGNCGKPMCGGNRRMRDGSREPEYYCSTYAKSVAGGQKGECSCLRHTVKQRFILEELVKYMDDVAEQLRAIEEVQRTGDLSLLTPYQEQIVDSLMAEEDNERKMFDCVFAPLQAPVSESALREEVNLLKIWRNTYYTDPNGFEDCLTSYFRHIFENNGPHHSEAAKKLKAEHATLLERHKALPPTAKRAQAALNEEILSLEAHLDQVESLLEDLASNRNRIADEVSAAMRRIKEASKSLKAEASNSIRREQAEFIGKVIDSIVLHFAPVSENEPRRTGQIRKRSTKLRRVSIVPKVGQPVVINKGCGGNNGSRGHNRGRD